MPVLPGRKLRTTLCALPLWLVCPQPQDFFDFIIFPGLMLNDPPLCGNLASLQSFRIEGLNSSEAW
jgi:hypothetical protein